MATGLHFFKFIPTEWLTGDIVHEDLAVQGLFINICAVYWHRDGNLTLEDVEKRYKKTENLSDLLATLKQHFIHVENGEIRILFLDEQLNDLNHVSEVNSENGKKGAEAKRLKKEGKQATAKRPLSEPEANTKQIKLNKIKLKEVRIEYAPNIFLTEKELEKFISELGAEKTKGVLNWFSNYSKEKPHKFKDYKDHNLTIRRWVIKAYEEQNGSNSDPKTAVVTKAIDIT